MLGEVKRATFVASQQVHLPRMEQTPQGLFQAAQTTLNKPTDPKLSAIFGGSVLSKAISVPFRFVTPSGAPANMSSPIEFRQSYSLLPKTGAFASMGNVSITDLITIQRIIPAVVRVSADGNDGSAWFGSGSIVEPASILPGYEAEAGEYFVLTNQHVADDAKQLTIKLANGQEYFAEVVRSPYGTKLIDAEMDVAVLRVRIPYSIPTAKIGDSSKLETGQPIFTAGHPRALPNVAVTKGIISNPQQETGELSLDIQSDAPINPGNSGGPAFNSEGEVVGLNTYTFREGEDLTFTKPINLQLETVRQIYDLGGVIRGSIGLTLAPLPLIERRDLGFPEDETGAVVRGVDAGSPAQQAGLKSGDIITWMEVRGMNGVIKFLDVDIHDWFEAGGAVRRWIAGITPGTRLHATVYRKGPKGAYAPFEVELTVGMDKAD